MEVILVRHAVAIDETRELQDPFRYLTPGGRAQAASLGERLRWHDVEPTHVWTSPFVRAVQTAELVAAALGASCPVAVVPVLAPGSPPRGIVAALERHAPTDQVIVFGHEPSLSAVAALLLGRTEVAPLAPAEALRVCDGELRWRFAWNADAPATA